MPIRFKSYIDIHFGLQNHFPNSGLMNLQSYLRPDKELIAKSTLVLEPDDEVRRKQETYNRFLWFVIQKVRENMKEKKSKNQEVTAVRK